jgi:hypothetical protein
MSTFAYYLILLHRLSSHQIEKPQNHSQVLLLSSPLPSENQDYFYHPKNRQNLRKDFNLLHPLDAKAFLDIACKIYWD